jgi:hypothetical protein
VREKYIILRLIWSCFLLLSVSYCSFLIIRQTIQYFEYDVTTASRIINEAPTAFPAVDICNLNAYDGNYAREIILKYSNESHMLDLNGMFARFDSDLIMKYMESVMESSSNLTFYGFYLDQLVISCRFYGEPCNLYEDFYWYHDYTYGNCYRFNSGLQREVYHFYNDSVDAKPIPIKNITKAAVTNGLQIELFSGDPDTQQQFSYKSGFRIIVHNQSVSPFPIEDGIDVACGQETNIAITRTFINKLPAPCSDCIIELDQETIKRNDILKLMRNLFNKTFYDQKYCLKLCLQQYLVGTCECADYRYPIYNFNSNLKVYRMRGCKSPDDLNCLNRANTLFYETNIEIIKCYEKCPLECNRVIYDSKISVASYPSRWYSKLLNKSKSFQNILNANKVKLNGDINDEYLKETILTVNVFYNELTYSEISESRAMTFDYMFGFVGGTIGLCLGISFLSLIELVEIFVNIFIILYKRRYKTFKKDKLTKK